MWNNKYKFIITILIFIYLNITNVVADEIDYITNDSGVTYDNQIGGESNDKINNIVETSDGGYLLVGESSSDASEEITDQNNGKNDGLLIKYNNSGEKEWDKQTGSDENDIFNDVIETSDGGYLAVGGSDSTIGGEITDANNGSFDGLVVKFDQYGNKEWDQLIGGSGVESFESVIETENQEYIIVGKSNSKTSGEITDSNNGETDGYIIKIDNQGNIIWDQLIGGSGSDYLEMIIETNDNGYIVVGYTNSNPSGDITDSNNGLEDGLIMKFNQTGEKEWDKQIGGSNTDVFNSIIETNDGNYLISGYSSSPFGGEITDINNGLEDGLLVKVDQYGNKIWDKQTGGSNNDHFESVIETDENEYIVSGYSNSPTSGEIIDQNNGESDGLIMKFNQNGDLLWDKQTGGESNDVFNGIIETEDKGYMAVGYSKSFSGEELNDYNNGESDGLVVKFDMIAPEITIYSEINKNLGDNKPTEKEYLENIKVSDNITLDENIKVKIDDNYIDMNTLGQYIVEVEAIDSVGNKAINEIYLNIY